MISQAAHAAHHATESIGSLTFGAEMRTAWMAWEKSTSQGFGTTIVYGGIKSWCTSGYDKILRGLTIDDIRVVVAAAIKLGYAAGIVTDPTYPLQDGKTLHTFPVETVGWCFASKVGLQHTLKDLVLHPESTSL